MKTGLNGILENSSEMLEIEISGGTCWHEVYFIRRYFFEPTSEDKIWNIAS